MKGSSKMKLQLIHVAIGSLACLLASQANAQSIFPDKVLETAVRREVFEKRMNDQPIVEGDVPNISQVKHKGKEGQKITNLAGMEKCRSVAEVALDFNEITDLTPLKDLKNIQSLSLKGNKIKDLTPLAGLVNLQYLNLEGNEVTDLTPLAGLVNMRSLYLSRNKVTDIGPIANMKKLWSLYLGGNQLTDLKPMAGLKDLDTIDLAYNQITDVSPLAELQPYRWLFLQKNQIKDISPLVAMAKKDSEGPKNFAPFWNVQLFGNPLSDAATNQQVPELKKYSFPDRIDLKSDRKVP